MTTKNLGFSEKTIGNAAAIYVTDSTRRVLCVRWADERGDLVVGMWECR